MTKKDYITPEVEIEEFKIRIYTDTVQVSPGNPEDDYIEDGDYEF